MTATQDELATARNAGRLEAEAFEGSLREAEQREREELLGRLSWRTDESAFGAPGTNYSVMRLQQDVARLATFHQAVLRSRAWRVVQWARRPFGRAW